MWSAMFSRAGQKCITGEHWGQCPPAFGDPLETSEPSDLGETIESSDTKCKGGAGKGGPAALSNFASYQVCLGGGSATCEASGSCSTDEHGVASYKCEITSQCIVASSVSCLSEKCDAESSNTDECQCARDLAS